VPPYALQIAIWNDGTVVYARYWHKPGENLFVAKLPPDRIKKFMDGLGGAGLDRASFDTARLSGLPETHIRFRDPKSGARRQHRWHGTISPLEPEIHDFKKEFLEFITMWQHVMLLACEIYPADGIPLAEAAKGETFRGILVNTPSKTQWIMMFEMWEK
jgi:hypothetical protein